LYGAAFLATLAFAALEGTFSLVAASRWALAPMEVAFLFAFLGVVSVVAQGFAVGRAVRRFGERGAGLLGLWTMGAGLAGVALAPSLPLLLAALALLAMGQGMASPALSSLVSRQAGPAEQGRVLGVHQSLGALGRVVGPVSGGFALAHAGAAAPYLLGAALAAGALALLAGVAGGGS
ncbi:MAG TPA: MFS transporter, partial [Longimicrobium sp.]|nr:MFS transporter [Longimicrobium sp.]